MSKKKPKKNRRIQQHSVDKPAPGTPPKEPMPDPDGGAPDYGGIPYRDIKKNLGCG